MCKYLKLRMTVENLCVCFCVIPSQHLVKKNIVFSYRSVELSEFAKAAKRKLQSVSPFVFVERIAQPKRKILSSFINLMCRSSVEHK